jgi:hypothetical protein
MCHWDINKVLRKIQGNLFFQIRVMEVGGRRHETGGQKWQGNCTVAGQSQAAYFSLVAEQYQTATQHNMHMTELEYMEHTDIIYAMVEKPTLANLWQ